MIVLTTGSGRLCALMEAEAAQPDVCARAGTTPAVRHGIWEGGVMAGIEGASSPAGPEDGFSFRDSSG